MSLESPLDTPSNQWNSRADIWLVLTTGSQLMNDANIIVNVNGVSLNFIVKKHQTYAKNTLHLTNSWALSASRYRNRIFVAMCAIDTHQHRLVFDNCRPIKHHPSSLKTFRTALTNYERWDASNYIIAEERNDAEYARGLAAREKVFACVLEHVRPYDSYPESESYTVGAYVCLPCVCLHRMTYTECVWQLELLVWNDYRMIQPWILCPSWRSIAKLVTYHSGSCTARISLCVCLLHELTLSEMGEIYSSQHNYAGFQRVWGTRLAANSRRHAYELWRAPTPNSSSGSSI